MKTHEIAAHRIADALTLIAEQLEHLTPEQRFLMRVDGKQRDLQTVLSHDHTLLTVARMLQDSAPYAEPTDDQKEAIWDMHNDMVRDSRSAEIVNDMVDGWTWQWREEADQYREALVEDDDTDGLTDWDKPAQNAD